jgi:hypothetical protein
MNRFEEITTTYDPTPIPVRCFDWIAHFTGDSEEPNDSGHGTMLVGWGTTEAEAVTNLIDAYEERQ